MRGELSVTSTHAPIPLQHPPTHRLLNQRPADMAGRYDTSQNLRLSRGGRARHGLRGLSCRRDAGSRPSRSPFGAHGDGRGFGEKAEVHIVRMDQGARQRSQKVFMADGIRGLLARRLAATGSDPIHRAAGGTSQDPLFPRRVQAVPSKIRDQLRRAVSVGLNARLMKRPWRTRKRGHDFTGVAPPGWYELPFQDRKPQTTQTNLRRFISENAAPQGAH